MSVDKNREKKVSDLHKHIGFWLRMVSNSVSHAFAKKLAEVDVSVAEWVVMREMYAGDETTAPSTIAELTGLTRGAISKLIDKLLKKGLVTRAEAQEDRRYQDIRLTRKAVSLVPRLAALADRNDEEFFAQLSSTERRELLTMLKKIAKLNGMTQVPIE